MDKHEVVDVFKALGHPARLWMVNYIRMREEVGVQEIVESLSLDFSTVSRHLKLLRDAQVLDCRREGRHCYYYLHLTCVTSFIDCLLETDFNNGCCQIKKESE